MEAFEEILSQCSIWRPSVVITVLLGTAPYQFPRLVTMVDKLAGNKGWDVFIQLGHTDYRPKNCKFEHFIDREYLLKKLKDSQMIICHGGFGSIRDGLHSGRPVIAVPRNKTFGELINNHQLELVNELESEGRVLAVYEIEKLPTVIEHAKSFRPNPGKGNRIPEILSQFLKTL